MSFGGGFGSNTGGGFSTPQSAGAFGSSNVFGNTPSPGGFGASTGSIFGSAPSSVVPGGGNIFGGNTSPQVFGSFTQQNRAFGGSSTIAPFGGGGTSFVAPTGSGNAPDGSQGTYRRALERVPEVSDVGSSGPKSYMMSLSAMKDLIRCQPEMLRAADYKKGHRRSSGQVQMPQMVASSGASSGVFGGGFGGSSSFGSGSSASIFGHSTPQSSGPFSSSFASTGTGFGQQPTGGGFGSTFQASTGSMFGGAGSTAFGHQSSSSMFGAPQSTSSIFGSQASAFGAGIGASTGTGLFGQSSMGSGFGASTSPGFGGMTGGSLFNQQSSTGFFGAQSSGGFAFGGSSSGGLFGGNASGGSIFGQQASSPAFAFGQTPSFMSAPQQQTPQPGGLFGAQPNQLQAGSPFGQPTVSQQQMTPQPGQLTLVPQASNPATHPHFFEQWGIVAPDPAEIFKDDIGFHYPSLTETADELMRRQSSKYFTSRLPARTLQYVYMEPAVEKKKEVAPDLGWESFALSPPVKDTLKDEIQRSIDKFHREAAEAGRSAPPSGQPLMPSSFATPDPEQRRMLGEAMGSPIDFQEDPSQDDVSTHLLPILTRPDYHLLPTLEELKKCVLSYGERSLRNVTAVEFSRTGFGKIVFSKPINLLKLNLDELVDIKRGRLEPGPASASVKNVPATVTLYKVFTKARARESYIASGADLAKEEERFRTMTVKMGARFRSYDRFGTWMFDIEGIGYSEAA